MDEDQTLKVAVVADTSGFERSLDDLTRRADSFGAAIASALRGAVSGGKSFDSVLQTLGTRISGIALDAALKPLTSLVGSVIGQAVGGLGAGIGGLFSGGATGASVQPFAKGGVVASPSFFSNGGNGNGRVGLMGEAGAEAILPLKRGADGTLGVATGGQGGGRTGGGPSIVFNVTTPDAASFKRSEAQVQAMLARAAQRGQRGL